MKISLQKSTILFFLWNLKKHFISTETTIEDPESETLNLAELADEVYKKQYITINKILSIAQSYPEDVPIENPNNFDNCFVIKDLKKTINIFDDETNVVIINFFEVVQHSIKIKKTLKSDSRINPSNMEVNGDLIFEIYNTAEIYTKYLKLKNDLDASKSCGIEDYIKFSNDLIKIIKSFLNHYLIKLICGNRYELINTQSDFKFLTIYRFFDDLVTETIKLHKKIQSAKIVTLTNLNFLKEKELKSEYFEFLDFCLKNFKRINKELRKQRLNICLFLFTELNKIDLKKFFNWTKIRKINCLFLWFFMEMDLDFEKQINKYETKLLDLKLALNFKEKEIDMLQKKDNFDVKMIQFKYYKKNFLEAKMNFDKAQNSDAAKKEFIKNITYLEKKGMELIQAKTDFLEAQKELSKATGEFNKVNDNTLKEKYMISETLREAKNSFLKLKRDYEKEIVNI